MGRIPSVVKTADEARTTVEEAQKCVSQRRSALTRANCELSQAETAFQKETKAVRGVLVEDYPQSYWDAENRRDQALFKMFDADEAFELAQEQLAAARDAEVNAVHAAAVDDMRRARRGAPRYYASA